jgi:hypothetical protein
MLVTFIVNLTAAAVIVRSSHLVADGPWGEYPRAAGSVLPRPTLRRVPPTLDAEVW